MPASSLDPISSSIHSSIESGRRECSLENLNTQVTISAKRVLLHPIEYKETTVQNSVLTSPQKSKYLILKTSTPSQNQINGDDHRKADVKTNGSSQDTLPLPKHTIYPPENIKLGWQGKEPVGSGFLNLGNTCYLNSTLQVLIITIYLSFVDFLCPLYCVVVQTVFKVLKRLSIIMAQKTLVRCHL